MAKKKKSSRTSKKTTRKKKTTKRKKKSNSGGEMLLVSSKTKEALKAHGCNVASDALDGLNNVVHWYLAQAAHRAAANGRKTVRDHDFLCM